VANPPSSSRFLIHAALHSFDSVDTTARKDESESADSLINHLSLASCIMSQQRPFPCTNLNRRNPFGQACITVAPGKHNAQPSSRATLASEPVKKARTITVSEKVFTSEDLRRIAAIFDRQRQLAEKSDHRASTEYGVRFEDQTTLETDSTGIFTDESLAFTSRPVRVNMSFRNYTLNRNMSLSLQHGDYGSEARITAQEEAWLSENFMALFEALGKVRPQVFWWKKHGTLSVSLIAFGIGASVDLLGSLLKNLIGPPTVSLPQGLESFMYFIDALPKFFLYVLRGLWLLITGFLGGAFPLYGWLQSAWPDVEFDFGSVVSIW
jgi:hypothetical protein